MKTHKIWSAWLAATLSGKCCVKDGEDSSLPEWVAAIDEFVGSTLESTLIGHLFHGCPSLEESTTVRLLENIKLSLNYIFL